MAGVRPTTAVSVMVLSLLLAGCSDGGSAPDAAPTVTASTGAGSATSTPSPSASVTGCRPSHRVRILKRVPTVLYSLRFEVAPGERKHGEQDATLYTYPDIAPGVFVTEPRNDLPSRRLTDAVLADVPQGSPALDGSRGLAWDVRNRSDTRGRYLAYGAAVVYRGTWTATTCQGKRERLSGTVVVVGRVKSGVVRCHARPTTDPVRRVAARTACTHDSSDARPFRIPDG